MLKIKDKLKIVERYGRWLRDGKKLTTYECGHCKASVITEQPEKGDVGSKGYWDTLTECILCGEVNFVCTWPSGRTVVKKFPGEYGGIIKT